MRKRIIKILQLCLLFLPDLVSAIDVEIIAHRGASFDAPENTLESVNLAWARQADAVEVDVYLTKDGQIVAFHDYNTKKITGVDRNIVDQTFSELSRLDVGSWKGSKWKGIRIPKLSDVIKTIPEGKRMFVEVKCGPEIISELASVFKKSGKKADQLVVISFDYEVVKQAKVIFPKIKCFYLSSFKIDEVSGKQVPTVEELISLAKEANLDGLNVSYKGLRKQDFFNKVKKAGLELFTWTVNSPMDANDLIKMGIQGITTDRPAWLKKRLK